MRICLYTPFKPINHPHPSGDLVIAGGIRDFLLKKGHRVWPVSRLRARWIYWKPWTWPGILKAYLKAKRFIDRIQPDLWLTYHTYYKAPDLLGPRICLEKNLPYFVFQGIYSTKRRKKTATRPGFYLNRYALLNARHLFVNRQEDHLNLKRLLPGEKLTYIRPGIFPEDFQFSREHRRALRKEWAVGPTPVIISAAMFRPGVKVKGLAYVIDICSRLLADGVDFHLVIIGDGKEKNRLQQLAEQSLGSKVRLTGKVPREKLYQYYSAGDLFVFPGFRESLGMVFLEAQACGLPVVALKNGGIPEVVQDNQTGRLVPLNDSNRFAQAVSQLLTDRDLRKKMGSAAADYVRRFHDLDINYEQLELILKQQLSKRLS